jgi:hypothetical protein
VSLAEKLPTYYTGPVARSTNDFPPREKIAAHHASRTTHITHDIWNLHGDEKDELLDEPKTNRTDHVLHLLLVFLPKTALTFLSIA